MTRVTAEVEVHVPSDAQVGDDFLLTGEARVTLIRDPQVDITGYSGRKTIAGEREYELLVLNGRLERMEGR